MIRAALAIAAVALTAAAPAQASSYVRDGDTVVVNNIPIRLKGLSCAELKTPLGQAQKTILMAAWNTSSRIEYTLTGETTWDRQVGWVSLDGKDIGELMIETANCQPCRRYDTTGRYAHYPVTGTVPKYCRK